jgi:transposase InsO family protein
MTVIMDDSGIRTLDQVRRVLKGAKGLWLKGQDRKDKYAWLGSTIRRFNYHSLEKKDKGPLRKYMMLITGFSKPQLNRLIARNQLMGRIESFAGRRNRFTARYTREDIELLAKVDNLHGRMSGPATKALLKRAYNVYGDERYERLWRISPAHIYNLRETPVYRNKALTIRKTRTVQISIGIRRKPNPDGKPGYLRVDSVHQGDYNGEKGVYHINLVDEVTQWEIILCVAAINEAMLEEALALALDLFPFVILNFHSDNGGEFINGLVADMLNKALIRQSKSRAGRTNDNALVEGKNGSVIRKHMGYWHIGRKYAPQVQGFYLSHFNDYLNYHRPCAFATITVDEKGRRTRHYRTYMTPFEKLASLPNAAAYLKPGITLSDLERKAMAQTDSEAAGLMQQAKDKLFRKVLAEEAWTKNVSTELRRKISGSSLD